LPAELYGKVAERVKATDFSSVDEYVEFVLEEVVKEEEEEKAFSEEEEKEVKKRLKDLGYLD
jgi:Arc/MetJ-type ribon-helix-helix transcriptional regulator